MIIDLIEPPQRNSITTGPPLASPRPSRGELDCVLNEPASHDPLRGVKVVACSTAQAGTVSYMKTPNALGVTIPPAILARADEMIE